MKAVAEARKLRPVFLERQPRTDRHRDMITTLSRPALDAVTGNLIRTWLIKKHKAMLVDFLNALNIPNNEGVVEDLPVTMDDAKLKSAVDVLVGKISALDAMQHKLKEHHIVVALCDEIVTASFLTSLASNVVIFYGDKAREISQAFGKDNVKPMPKYVTTKEKLPSEVETVILE